MDAIVSSATSADSSTTPITPECAAEILGRLPLVPDRRDDRATATPTPPVNGIAALDVPAVEVEREIKLRMAYELDRLQQRMSLDDAPLAAQRAYLDPDPDPALFQLPGIAHPKEVDRG